MFTPAGQRALAASAEDCTDELIARHPFGHIASYTYDQHPLDDTQLSRELVVKSPLGKGVPRVQTPVYDYHATADELVPVAIDDDLVAGYCAAGVPVQKVRYRCGDHNSKLLTGAPSAEQFVADRFAARPVVDNCPPCSTGSRTWRRVVIVTGRGGLARPGSIVLAGHPRATISGLRWRHWGRAVGDRTRAVRGPLRVGAPLRRPPAISRIPSTRDRQSAAAVRGDRPADDGRVRVQAPALRARRPAAARPAPPIRSPFGMSRSGVSAA